MADPTTLIRMPGREEDGPGQVLQAWSPVLRPVPGCGRVAGGSRAAAARAGAPPRKRQRASRRTRDYLPCCPGHAAAVTAPHRSPGDSQPAPEPSAGRAVCWRARKRPGKAWRGLQGGWQFISRRTAEHRVRPRHTFSIRRSGQGWSSPPSPGPCWPSPAPCGSRSRLKQGSIQAQSVAGTLTRVNLVAGRLLLAPAPGEAFVIPAASVGARCVSALGQHGV
jgi:hypothetical protein